MPSENFVSCPESECGFTGRTDKAFKSHYANAHEKPYPWKPPNEYGHGWESRRNEIIERDNQTCQECGRVFDDPDCVVQPHVHHIDGDKSNANSENLITLCRICHTIQHVQKEDDSDE